jgi:hypothetical protein
MGSVADLTKNGSEPLRLREPFRCASRGSGQTKNLSSQATNIYTDIEVTIQIQKKEPLNVSQLVR